MTLFQGLLEPEDPRLLFKPPVPESPTIWEVEAGTSFASSTKAMAGGDLIIKLPHVNKLRGISVTGTVANVFIEGGSIDLSQPGSSKISHCLSLACVTDGIYVEGVYLNADGAEIDCFQFGSAKGSGELPFVFIQNCRFMGGIGSTESAVHPDLAQSVAGGTGGVYFDKFTGYTGYQGLIGDGGANVAVGEWFTHRVNLGYLTTEAGLQDNGFLIYYHDVEDPTHEFPWTAEKTYLDRGKSKRSLTQSLIWPGEGHPGGVESSDEGRTLRMQGMEGFVTTGPPPDGDYVTTADCGLGYVSPGYQ